MAIFASNIITSDSALGSAVIQRSLRFNSSDNTRLTRTPSSNGDKRTWTISFWIKRSAFTTSLNGLMVSGTNNPDTIIKLDSGRFEISRYGGGYTNRVTSSARLRDFSAWYHLVGAVDTTQSTAANRVRLYINGTEVTDFDNSSYPSENYEYPEMNDTGNAVKIGHHNTGGTPQQLDAYLAEFNFIDGQQLDPSYFGFTDPQTSIWMPKRYEGTYGTNGFNLDFSDNSSTSTLGIDKSTNGNDFTASNFSVGDSVPDTPTNNFCTLNNNDNNLSESSPHFDYSQGNLKVAWSFSGTNFDRAYGTLFIEPHDTNKYYWEATGTQNNEQMQWGVVATDTTAYRQDNRNTNPTKEANLAIAMWQPYTDNGIYAIDNSGGDYGDKLTLSNGAPANGDIFSFVYDAGAGKFYVFFKGVEPTGQDYSAGTTLFDTLDTSKTYAIHSLQGDGGVSTKSGNFIMNFGQDSSFAGTKTAQGNKDAKGIGDFYYPVPSGAVTLCSKNLLPNDSIISRPQRHFDTVLWSGNGTSGRVITDLEFQPDFVWIKCRSNDPSHKLFDVIRGGGKVLDADSTTSEQTNQEYGYLSAFNTKGFTLTQGTNGSFPMGNVNHSGRTYVAWCWKGGGAAVSNSDGTITSSVSVNQEAGFSIVSYTGNGSAGATVGHGLGKKPAWILLIRRDSNDNRYIYHQFMNQGSNPEQHYSELNFHAGATDSNKIHNDTAPTTSVFSLSNDNASNGNTYPYIAYCWTEIPGYSKFGEYRANGVDTNGPYTHLGFRPAWVMIKSMSLSNSDWTIFDNKRNTVNPANTHLAANQNHADGSDNYEIVDFLSDGFKVTGLSGSAINYNTSYPLLLYMAFAEQPSVTPFDTFSNAR